MKPVLALVGLLASAPALAAPVTRSCAYQGPGDYGLLSLTVDESTRLVRVVTAGGRVSIYRDGERATICATTPGEDAPDCPFADEFVTFKPDRVEVGFRWPDTGALAHMSYFNRSALTNLSAPCLWRSLWDFGEG